MKKTICDYCGKEIERRSNEFTGDLDGRNLAVIKVEPLLLNQTDSKIDNPDFSLNCFLNQFSL